MVLLPEPDTPIIYTTESSAFIIPIKIKDSHKSVPGDSAGSCICL
jgi:hypothetical protein